MGRVLVEKDKIKKKYHQFKQEEAKKDLPKLELQNKTLKRELKSLKKHQKHLEEENEDLKDQMDALDVSRFVSPLFRSNN